MKRHPNTLSKLLFALALPLLAEVQAAPRPNIILIMGDDMGISDLGCYGSEIETPTLDKLAAGGLRFTQFYNTARCCPTRASLLSGLYPHQAGVGHMMNDRGHPGYRGELNRECLTIAEALKTAGYGTYMAGKWHVTKHTAPDGPKDNWPRGRGFDRFYGTIHGAGSLWDPNSLTRDDTQLAPDNDPEYTPEKEWFYTDAIADQTARYITEHAKAKPDAPFFCYVSFTAAHWPMHAREETIAKYKGKYDKGYAALRAARFEKMKKLGLIDADTDLSPAPWQWGKIKEEAWELRCMEVYAAMVDEMDQGIGRIVDAVERAGQSDNTLIFFLQDNGGCAEGYGRGGKFKPRADKATLPPMKKGELQTRMQPAQTRDGYPVRTGPGVMPGPADTYIAYGQGWANVSNTPFREYKHWVHEGGISTPLIAHWPAGIKRGGKLDRQPGHLIDIMATCVDLGGIDYPKEKDGNKIKPLEGRSLAPAFAGESIERETLFWEHEGNCAIRKGEWKLVRNARKAWELYNIAADRTELHDLAAEKPELVKTLSAEFDAYAERANVAPVGTFRGKVKPKAKKKPKTAGVSDHGRPLVHYVAAPKPGTKPKKAGPMTLIVDDPKLPRVLLIGDSISIGYTLPTRALLKGKANVHRPPTNCASTKQGLKKLDAWLGKRKWDLIHFNWGLHDLKYVLDGEKLVPVKTKGAHQQVPIDQYEENLTKLVLRLKVTGAKLIWRNTTPVPEGAGGRVPGDAAKYNAVAKKIMDANGVTTQDLHTFAKERWKEIGRPANVHFTPEGSKKLAKEVAELIGEQL